MKYLLAITVFLAGALFPLALTGQSTALMSGSSAPGFWAPPGFRVLGGTRAIVFPSFYGYPESYPFTYFYPSLWPPLDVEYQQASLIANGDVAAEVAAQEKEYLSSQVQALTNEVHSLREQQSLRQIVQGPAASSGVETSGRPLPQAESRAQQAFPVTVFIYRDGHEMEVRDYAIFGDTLWVFNGPAARKFPLSDFNIEASRQVNEEHGVEFPLSGPHRP
ncbi:MAG: hypothetical protein EPN47_08105 [Acidobacteria bacterium]|nr:MAG: hypothetical protein EPN47_08105 [Acidobacteriota bacterium]